MFWGWRRPCLLYHVEFLSTLHGMAIAYADGLFVIPFGRSRIMAGTHMRVSDLSLQQKDWARAGVTSRYI